MRPWLLALLLSGCHSAGGSADAAMDLASEGGDLASASSDMATQPSGDLAGLSDPNGNKGTVTITSGSYVIGSNNVTSASAQASFVSVTGAAIPTCNPPTAIGPCVVIGGCAGTLMTGTTTAMSAGQVTVVGGTPMVTLSPDTSNQYAPFSQSSALWTTATTLTVAAAGGAVPSFSTMLTAPAQPDFTTPTFPASGSLTINRSADFPVTWTGGSGGTVTVQLQTNTAQAEFVRCTYDGSANGGTIPSAALQQVQAGATGNLAVSVTSSVIVVMGNWTITVMAQTPATQGGKLLASGASVTFQ